VFADLNRYEVTTHFNGQSIVTLDGHRATGESYTIAHHLYTEDGDRKIMVAHHSTTSTPSRRSTGGGTSPNANSYSTGAKRDR
jgi:SnoaL-like domain